MKRLALLFLALFFGCFLIYPLIGLLGGAFLLADAQGHKTFTLSFFQLLIENRLYRLSLVNSFEIALLSTVFTALVSIPLAVLFTRYRFPGRELLRPMLLAPLILPPFVGALGIKHIFARFGALNLLLAKLGIISLAHPIDWLGASGFTGIVVLEILHLFPIFFLGVSAALANIDPSLLDAAANLGASAWRRFTTVTLPLARPGLFAGACIVFISAFTDLGTPLIFNFYATVPTQIFNASVDANSEQIGYAFVVATLVLVLVLFLLVRRFGESSASIMPARASHAAAEETLSPWAGRCATAAVAVFLLVAILPHIGVVASSFAERWFFTILPTKLSTQYYAEVFTDPTNARFVTNSLFYSGLSAFLDLGLGVVIAHLLARESFPGKSLLDALAMLPLALPGLVLAFALLMSYNLHGWWAWINPRTNPTFLLVVSYALRRLPYIVRAAYAGYQQTSVALEEASYNLGAGRWRTFRRVTLPLIAPSLIAGTILTFCFAMLEVSDSLILAMEARFDPITRGIYEIMGRPSPDSAALACALGVLAMGLLGGGLLLGSRLMGRRLGGFFRV
ncbi:MAG: iron ABC transporter permease [Methylacidiphilales bacterium]|nr:iron ABC transporter permease [Candidatus Methylacidiphilales bacterium]